MAAPASAKTVPASYQWELHKSPSAISGESSSLLEGVACITSSNCYAVGLSTDEPGSNLTITPPAQPIPGRLGIPANTSIPLVEHFNGKNWTIQPSPVVSGLLMSVSCTGPAFCVAVGATSLTNTTQTSTLIEEYNGSEWTVVSSPNYETSAGNQNFLGSVSCASSDDCVAVGGDGITLQEPGSPYEEEQLVTSFNGDSWAPDQISTEWQGFWNGVSCSGNYCLAVGYGDVTSGETLQYAEERTGSEWTPTAAVPPHPANGLDCVLGDDCVAVGGETPAPTSEYAVPNSEQYGSVGWAVIGAESVPSWNSVLMAVTCASAKCFAVGNSTSDPWHPFGKTLIEQRVGDAWKVVKSPDASRPAIGNSLTAVSCMSGTSCIAVGYSVDGTLASQTASPLVLALQKVEKRAKR